MKATKIEWCDATLNPVVGCTHGCEYCYAERMNRRFGWVKNFKVPQFFPDRLEQLDSKKPKVIFMDSMSDIADWKKAWRKQVYDAISKNPQHTYMFLTKRPDEAHFIIGKNVWNGVSVTRQSETEKINPLRRLEHFNQNQFVSFEPILGPITFTMLCMNWIGWAVLGAETGNRKDKFIPSKEDVMNIVYALWPCDIPIFMKDSLIPIVGEENMLRQFPKFISKGE